MARASASSVILQIAAAAGLAALITISCAPHERSALKFLDSAGQTPFETSSLVPVAPPPFSEGIYPCSQCHSPEDEIDRTPRKVEYHDQVDLKHDEKNRWCLDCHDAKNRDKLHLADGRLIDFTESYRLCGQCHGPTLRNWRAGEHGKRTGSWSGEKLYLLCANCHNPHSPRFKPIEPKDPPPRQETMR